METGYSIRQLRYSIWRRRRVVMAGELDHPIHVARKLAQAGILKQGVENHA
jgi:hypothetical protein